MMTNEIKAILFLLAMMMLGGVATMYVLLREANDRAATCTVSIKEQNDAIEALSDKAAKDAALQKERDKKAASDAKKAEKDAASIMAEKIPDGCEESVRWGITKAKELKIK